MKGLPPPVWGEGGEREPKLKTWRITPTSVGRRETWPTLYDHRKDYPHQCGEKIRASDGRTVYTGLPPPVWGEENR